MSTFTETITVDAPVARVWETLADIGSIQDWNPGVRESFTLTETATGLGAKRRCELGGHNYLEESVAAFVAHKQLTMRIDATNLPFARADIRFDLDGRGDRTTVRVSPDYELKYGALGRLMDRIAVRRTYRKGMVALLAGLKRHVEDGSAS